MLVADGLAAIVQEVTEAEHESIAETVVEFDDVALPISATTCPVRVGERADAAHVIGQGSIRGRGPDQDVEQGTQARRVDDRLGRRPRDGDLLRRQEGRDCVCEEDDCACGEGEAGSESINEMGDGRWETSDNCQIG